MLISTILKVLNFRRRITTTDIQAKTINPDGANGVFFGNAPQLGIQCLAVFVTVVYAFLLSYVLLKIVDKIFGLRVAEDEEVKGLDLSQHNEAAYSL